jgi:hypothetical protein
VTVVETALVFAAIPLGVVVLAAIAVYGRSMVHQPNRYRPGKPWPYGPVWFVPHPEALENTAHATVVSPRREIEGAAGGTTALGGASGEW